MGRLIDADAFKASLEELQPKLDLLASMCVSEVIELMNEQPTAYNPEKVVEELEVYSTTEYIRTTRRLKPIRVVSLEDCKKIVRRGGVE